MSSVIVLIGLCLLGSVRGVSYVHVRGHSTLQKLPMSHAKHFPVWTYSTAMHTISPVETNEEEGWVNPTSFNTLFVPVDLPVPKASPALGVAVVQGIPRYVMPSLILSLETKHLDKANKEHRRIWRNRGISSIPRSHAWIDLFGDSLPALDYLTVSFFGKHNPKHDAEWSCLLHKKKTEHATEMISMEISTTLNEVKRYLRETSDEEVDKLREGFHFIDIPLPHKYDFILPGSHVHGFLTDIPQPQRLLSLYQDDTSGLQDYLDTEACAELCFSIEQTSSGKSSPYMSDVYKVLYDQLSDSI